MEHGAFLSSAELAKRWNLHVVTLANWRVQKRGPAFVKLGAKVLYPLDGVLKYEQKNMHLAPANDNAQA
jgi:hypothetical protein